jgi:hypothetical protein
MENKMNMTKKYFLRLAILTLLFVGCAEKHIIKEESKTIVKPDDNRTLVINKTIKECAEHTIILDRERTTDFMQRTPQATIEKAIKNQEKTSKDLCQFFEKETSAEKIEKADELASKIMASCQKVGVKLSEKGIQNKVIGLPFFIIEKGLKVQSESTVQECELMKKMYQ